jgi:hypothetical protein
MKLLFILLDMEVDLNKDNQVNFFSDFRQLDYVKIVSYEIGSGN